MKASERGQALTEYVLAAGALVLALFVPWPWPPPLLPNTSLFVNLIYVFDIYLNSFHTVVSLPVP